MTCEVARMSKDPMVQMRTHFILKSKNTLIKKHQMNQELPV